MAALDTNTLIYGQAKVTELTLDWYGVDIVMDPPGPTGVLSLVLFTNTTMDYERNGRETPKPRRIM